ncbi:MAG: IS200/IS605 family transposase [Dehalococcoidales bacterium]|nr:IS200/IS605 family transposase [Dehalococcoidales bacterium]
MSREYKHDAHRVHLVLYHLIWCPKRRKAVLTGNVAIRLDQILHDVAASHNWNIERLAIQPDHLHLFIQGDSITPAHEMVRLLKGRSAHDLRKEFPTLLRLPSLWTRSYFCATAGNVSAQAIERYIEAQKGT